MSRDHVGLPNGHVSQNYFAAKQRNNNNNKRVTVATVLPEEMTKNCKKIKQNTFTDGIFGIHPNIVYTAQFLKDHNSLSHFPNKLFVCKIGLF